MLARDLPFGEIEKAAGKSGLSLVVSPPHGKLEGSTLGLYQKSSHPDTLGCFGPDLFGRRDSAQSHPYVPRISGIMSNQVGNAHDPPDVIILIDHRESTNLMFCHPCQDLSDFRIRSAGDQIGHHAVLNRGQGRIVRFP